MENVGPCALPPVPYFVTYDLVNYKNYVVSTNEFCIQYMYKCV